MFERYTEKARRVIFYSRYEASQVGSPYIEIEHLLLGILRESRELLRLFPNLEAEPIRAQIEKLQLRRESVSTSVDLPLSNECKRVLAHAAEEAEAMGHKHIGTEHLFLGLLREPNTLAANLLGERGVMLKEAREEIAKHETWLAPVIGPKPASGTRAERRIPVVRGYKDFAWQKQPWKASDILVDKQTRRVLFYAGEKFDETKFELKRSGWTRDQCVLCGWELRETDDPQHGVGYTNGRDWICTQCHEKFFAPPVTPLDELYT
jgi:hypothetical protein